jgi:DNA repair protein RadC
MKDVENNYLAEIEINYKLSFSQFAQKTVLSAKDAEEVFRELWSNRMDHIEEFVIICLNRANDVLGWTRISQGGICGCVADIRIIFQAALKANASGIIVAHNHPSGKLKPSDSDLQLTKRLKSGGEIMDIKLLDHLILTSQSFYSFTEEGHM